MTTKRADNEGSVYYLNKRDRWMYAYGDIDYLGVELTIDVLA